jgi:hypothetical protein
MRTRPKRKHGAQPENQNAVKEPEEKSKKILVSARIEPEIFKVLKARAKKSGNTHSREIELILSQFLSSPSTKAEP